MSPRSKETKGVRIGNDAHDDLVEHQPVRNEELVELLERVMVALDVLDQLERPRADRLEIGRMALQILAVSIDVLGQDRHQSRRHGEQQRRLRIRQADDRGILIRRVDLLDRREHRLERMVRLDRHDREGDILGRDRRIVLEERVVDEVQRHRKAVLRDLPGLGEIGMGVPVRVVAQRAGENLRARHGGGDAGLHGAVEMARLLRRADHEGPAALRVCGGQAAGRDRRGQRECERRD